MKEIWAWILIIVVAIAIFSIGYGTGRTHAMDNNVDVNQNCPKEDYYRGWDLCVNFIQFCLEREDCDVAQINKIIR